MTEELIYELDMIQKTLEEYKDYIIELYDKELPKRDYEEITALCYLVNENDDFIQWIGAYYELYESIEDIKEEYGC